MKFRMITFMLAIAMLSAMSACGPNKKRKTAIDNNRAKAAARSGAQDPALAKKVLEQPLPHLADGQATLRESCPPVSMQYSGSEKEITAQSREILDEGGVFEFSRATVHAQHITKTGEVGMIAGTVTGPLAVTGKSSENNTAAKVTCHTSKAAVTKGKTVPGSEVALPVPAQITSKSGQASAMALINLQARQGKVAGRVTMMPQQSNIDALLGQTAAGDGKDKASLTYDTDKNLHYRFQQTSVGPDGDQVVNTIEAVYTKKR